MYTAVKLGHGLVIYILYYFTLVYIILRWCNYLSISVCKIGADDMVPHEQYQEAVIYNRYHVIASVDVFH